MSARFVKTHKWVPARNLPGGQTLCGKGLALDKYSSTEAVTAIGDRLDVTLKDRDVTCNACLKKLNKQ